MNFPGILLDWFGVAIVSLPMAILFMLLVVLILIIGLTIVFVRYPLVAYLTRLSNL